MAAIKEKFKNYIEKLIEDATEETKNKEIISECEYEWYIDNWNKLHDPEVNYFKWSLKNWIKFDRDEKQYFTKCAQGWCIYLFPNGYSDNNYGENISIFLGNDNRSKEKKNICFNYVIYIRNYNNYDNYIVQESSSLKSRNLGFLNFIDKDTFEDPNRHLLENGKTIVGIRIRFYNLNKQRLDKFEQKEREEREWEALQVICIDGKIDELYNLFATKEIDLTKTTVNGWSALHIATFNNKPEIVECLLDHNAEIDVEMDEYTPLYIASQNGFTDIVELLVGRGADIDKKTKGWTPVQIACRNGHIDVVEFLLNYGANPIVNNEGEGEYNLLHIASYENKLGTDQTSHDLFVEDTLPMVKFLIEERGFDPNEKDSNGMAPFHLAARSNRSDIVDYLFTCSNVNIECEDHDLNLPIHIACQNGSIDVIRSILCRYTVFIHSPNVKGYTPLHMACEYGDIDIVKLLVEYGANINAMTIQKSTPLFFAVSKNYTDIVEYLLQKKPVIKDINECKMLINTANRLRNKTIKNLLITYFNKSNIQNELHWNSDNYLNRQRQNAVVNKMASDDININIPFNKDDNNNYLTVDKYNAYFGSTLPRNRNKNKISHIRYHSDSGQPSSSELGYFESEPYKRDQLINGSSESEKITNTNYMSSLVVIKNYEFIDNSSLLMNSSFDPVDILIKHIKDNNFAKVMNFINTKSDHINNFDSINSWTPLHYATYYNNLEMVNLLIENGAQTRHKTLNGVDGSDYLKGKTAREMAKILGYSEVEKKLRNNIYFKRFNVIFDVTKKVGVEVIKFVI